MIASFDIGEKNFAYCIGTASNVKKFRHENVLKKSRQTVLESCDLISKLLSEEDFSGCFRVIIEQQMRVNTRAQRISQHVWTWFRLMKPELNPIFVRSSLKTQHFLGKNSMTSRERKKWAVEKAIEILTSSHDEINLDYINKCVKKDDVADTYLQLIAYESSLVKD
jgi:hypothetical protein